MFGAPLTAAQVVERIVTDVRAGGDGKLLYYTNLIDKAGLSVQNIRSARLNLQKPDNQLMPKR